MAITAFLYGNAPAKAFNKEIDWNEASKIKVLLCTSSYTPDQDTHGYLDDITNEHASGSGYTTGGEVMTTCAVTYTAGTNVVKLDADDVTWSSATITCRYAVIYYDTSVASTSPLIGYINFGADVGVTGADFTVQWDEDGIFTFTVA